MTVAFNAQPPVGPSGIVPVSVPAHSTLQVAQVWNGRILAYRLLHGAARLTLGPDVRASFPVPLPSDAGKRLTFVRLTGRRSKARCTITLVPGMTGEVVVDSRSQRIADILAAPDPQPKRRPSARRDVVLSPGDRAKVSLDGIPAMRFEVRWVEAPVHVPRPRPGQTEPILFRIGVGTSLVLGLLATLAIFTARNEPPPPLAINSERAAKIVPPPAPPKPERTKAREKDAEKEKAEQGQMKKAKGDQGRLGRQDAETKETVIPKGERDILRDKVSKVGLLGLIGKEQRAGSGLAKLFADDSNEVEQAVAGMKGAQMSVGRGAGGLSTTGTGLGGGGTGLGHLYGAGDLDTGGRGRHGHGTGHAPTLAGRKEREVSVDTKGGNVDEGGGLSKEQVAKVVRAHQSAIKFCYEKELQRKPQLSGTIEINWTISPDGSVEKSRLAKSSMSDDAVEGCAARQVKQWVFPKSSGRTIVTFPFTFRGGG